MLSHYHVVPSLDFSQLLLDTSQKPIHHLHWAVVIFPPCCLFNIAMHELGPLFD